MLREVLLVRGCASSTGRSVYSSCPPERDLTVVDVREMLCRWCTRLFGTLRDCLFPEGRPLLVCRARSLTVLRSLTSRLTRRCCRLSRRGGIDAILADVGEASALYRPLYCGLGRTVRRLSAGIRSAETAGKFS